MVIWDNGCVLHRADHAGVVGDRVMHRGMVASLRELSPASSRQSRRAPRPGSVRLPPRLRRIT